MYMWFLTPQLHVVNKMTNDYLVIKVTIMPLENHRKLTSYAAAETSGVGSNLQVGGGHNAGALRRPKIFDVPPHVPPT